VALAAGGEEVSIMAIGGISDEESKRTVYLQLFPQGEDAPDPTYVASCRQKGCPWVELSASSPAEPGFYGALHTQETGHTVEVTMESPYARCSVR
jgi:hypothetical protein